MCGQYKKYSDFGQELIALNHAWSHKVRCFFHLQASPSYEPERYTGVKSCCTKAFVTRNSPATWYHSRRATDTLLLEPKRRKLVQQGNEGN